MFKVFYIEKSCTQKYSHVRMSETGHLIKSNICWPYLNLSPQSALKLISDVFEPQYCS